MYVDAVDAQILAALQGNGRATLAELAALTGKSPPACQRRQKRLETSGVIKRYAALVEPEAVGYTIQVFTTVSVERDEADTFERFEAALRAEPAIIFATLVTGPADFLLWIVARDLSAYRAILKRLTDVFPTLKGVTTHVVLGEVKPGFVVPAESLGDTNGAEQG